MVSTFAGLALKLDIDKSRVSNPQPTIFLCGGCVGPSNEAAKTLRGALMEFLRAQASEVHPRILLAESAAAWPGYEKHFQNLVDLETHLAALSTMILLIVESAGSIAELGAFSFVETMLKKLWVIADEHYDKHSSFIRTGPIAKLESVCSSQASRYYAYEWSSIADDGKRQFNAVLAADISATITNQILKPALAEAPRLEQFRRDNLGHLIMFVADLIAIGGPLIVTEIIELVRGCGFQDFDLASAQRYLYLLENIKLISSHRRGHYDFFFTTNPSSKFVQYAAKNRASFDREDFSFQIREVQKKTAASIHGDRTAVFSKFLKGEHR